MLGYKLHTIINRQIRKFAPKLVCKAMEEWILIDTETSGIIDPIYILEVYAQKMHKTTPIGDGFHAFINHGVPIPEEATAIHGYTEHFLSKVGLAPEVAHQKLRQYALGLPICSHNLGYDWSRCLVPETNRLNQPRPGTKGFCTLQLFRRALPHQESYKLDNLRLKYDLSFPAHSAKGDVLTVIDILQNKVSPLLIKYGLHSYKSIVELSKTTPISLCRDALGLDNPKPNIPDLPVAENLLSTLANTEDLTEVEEPYIQALDQWLSSKEPPTIKDLQITDKITKILSEGIITKETRLDIIDLIQPLLPFQTTLTEEGKEVEKTKDTYQPNPKFTRYAKPDKAINIPATKRQMDYILALGGKPEKPLSTKEASKMIDGLKSKGRTNDRRSHSKFYNTKANFLNKLGEM
jgi:DNA polymerase III epsilon subunit-like protein